MLISTVWPSQCVVLMSGGEAVRAVIGDDVVV